MLVDFFLSTSNILVEQTRFGCFSASEKKTHTNVTFDRCFSTFPLYEMQDLDFSSAEAFPSLAGA